LGRPRSIRRSDGGGSVTRQPAFGQVVHRAVGDLANTDKLMNDAPWIGVWPGIGNAERD
jgi:CDP-4-dehydro-6-deoxyglucose reductase, E1